MPCIPSMKGFDTGIRGLYNPWKGWGCDGQENLVWLSDTDGWELARKPL